MHHRIRNLFALASAVVALSTRTATTATELSSAVQDRLTALARAHALTLPKASNGCNEEETATTLHALIQTILAPYDGRTEDNRVRVLIGGPDIPIAGRPLTNLALLLHEFATNAAKYGALSMPEGGVNIKCHEDDEQFVLTWTERGGPRIHHQPNGDGFGSLLARATVKGPLGGEISRDWKPEGLTIRLSIAMNARLTTPGCIGCPGLVKK
jgi:two-component sensor histidine kinase